MHSQFRAVFCLGKAIFYGHIACMKSPCVKTCLIDQQTGICTGCLRTLDEITGWASYSDQKRDEIMSDLDKRRGWSDAAGGR